MESIFISHVDQLLEGGGSFVRRTGEDKASCKEGEDWSATKKCDNDCGAGRQRCRDLQWAELSVRLIQ